MARLLALCALILLAACDAREVVVVYSPHGPDVGKDYERLFEAAHPNIDVQWLDMGSQEVYTRISAERSRPACDVWWGAPSTMFMQAAREGLLAEYKPDWADTVDAADKDSANRWFGIYRTPLSMFFNSNKYKRTDVPQTWDALLDPKWKDKITIRKPPASGTMRTFIGAMILRAPNEDAGIDWLKRFHAQTKSYQETPQLLFDQIKRSDDMITVWIMPDAVLQRERNGSPFDFVVPQPTPVLTEAIAIVEGAPHRANAELFYDFVTTVDAFVHQAEAYAKIPARRDIQASQLPAWMTEQTIEPMQIDWDNFAKNEQRWMDRWEKEVYSAR
jgi:iron(III) transport system substrate-binding protein